MRAAPVQAGGVKHPVQRLPDVGFIERAATDRGEDPLGPRLALLQPSASLPTPPQAQRRLQLPREVHTSPLMVLRRGELSTHEIALHPDEAGLPIEVGPLQRQQLAGSQPSPQGTQQPRIPVRKSLTAAARDKPVEPVQTLDITGAARGHLEGGQAVTLDELVEVLAKLQKLSYGVRTVTQVRHGGDPTQTVENYGRVCRG